MLIFINPLVICFILCIFGTTWVQRLMTELKLFNQAESSNILASPRSDSQWTPLSTAPFGAHSDSAPKQQPTTHAANLLSEKVLHTP